MKKRFLSLILALAMSVSLLVLPAQAAYSDVKDSYLSFAAESLRLMGVMGGYGDGTFRPGAVLTRAQFCKMAVHAMDVGDKLGQYRGITIFPDVKPSHWAAAYINTAAKMRIGDSEKGQAVIGGYVDGTFKPDNSITAGQAVTILLRILGYTNADMSGVWPVSQMALGKSIGLTDGINLPNGNAPLTRGQAAELFVNLLRCKTKSGGTLYTLSEKTALISVDGSGTMKTADKSYPMVRTAASSSLVGAQGYVVLNSKGNALTFLPLGGGNTGVSAAAVIIYRDGSSEGLSSLTGGASYKLYKNGLPASAKDLRKDDVAVCYDGQTVQVCDTRVNVCYESCTPSPSAPATITVLGGTVLNVLPTARESLSKFKPGDRMTLLLSADGQVAAAVQVDSGVAANAMAVVSSDGTVRLLCGEQEIKLEKKMDQPMYFGQMVQISSGRSGEVSLSKVGNTSGALNVTARKLGEKELAGNVLLYRNGERITLGQLETDTISASRIAYARTNWAGKVDLIILNDEDGTVYYGRTTIDAPIDEDGVKKWIVSLDYKSGKLEDLYDPAGTLSNGIFARVVYRGKRDCSITLLQRFRDIPDSAWNGDGAVTAGGRTYTVPKDVLCYNNAISAWISYGEARAYSDKCDLWTYDGVVRVITVGN